jgi:hypothetical protein
LLLKIGSINTSFCVAMIFPYPWAKPLDLRRFR